MKVRSFALLVATCVGCASGLLFHSGPRPPELVGTSIDASRFARMGAIDGWRLSNAHHQGAQRQSSIFSKCD